MSASFQCLVLTYLRSRVISKGVTWLCSYLIPYLSLSSPGGNLMFLLPLMWAFVPLFFCQTVCFFQLRVLPRVPVVLSPFVCVVLRTNLTIIPEKYTFPIDLKILFSNLQEKVSKSRNWSWNGKLIQFFYSEMHCSKITSKINS